MSKGEWKENFLKIWVYHARLSSFVEIPKNTVPFDTGNCRNLKKPEVLVEWKAPAFSGKFPTMMSCQIFRFQFRISVSVGYARYIAQTRIPSPRRFKVQQMGSILSYFFSKGDDSKEKDSSTVQVRRRHSTICIELNRNSFTKLSVSGQLV